jgi:hypothetical protein
MSLMMMANEISENDRGGKQLFSDVPIGAANNLNCPLLDIEVLRQLEKRIPMLFVFAHCGQARGTPGHVSSRMSGFGEKSFPGHTANVGIAGAKRTLDSALSNHRQ